ncbi:cyclase family protein [Pseudonocardia oroxyli]|uniref:Kynurenine formamidase n=1 Tax=Pseudonocardia oroxyli TaxID=366584 RepID=A0A1G8D5Q6_PSEOR|nr:cyclase family protein [Pseudonocardia oroxyli]SDH53107.1 Kynurenine formamidase [Pseudonocardia oroxyli]
MSSSPSSDDVRSYLFERNNWGRWGEHDERGAINLITPEKRLSALASVRTGETLSLSRPISTRASGNNPQPALHYVKTWHGSGDEVSPRSATAESGGFAADFYGVFYHGCSTTHLDALSHVWDEQGLYNNRDPADHITSDGVTFGGVQHWSSDIVTRAVLLDIPRYRGVDYVSVDSPVHGWELEGAARQQGVALTPGDAVCVYMGREKWQADNPDTLYGDHAAGERPGMHASCLPFLRDNDVSVLGWDMLDAKPWAYDVAFTVHGSIWAYGLALVDNMVLEPLAEACAARRAHDFMLLVAPLVVPGGTGSPVNPIALL